MLDDQIEVYERISDSLIKANIQTHFTDQYDHALHYIRKERPDVILTDIFLGSDDPKGKGLLLLDELVSNSETFSIPVIMYSGDSKRSYSTCHKAYELGAESYLRKPLDHGELVSTITNAAHRYRFIQESLASQFIPRLELKNIFLEPKLTYSLNIALIANQRNGFAPYNYLKKFLTAHDQIDITIFETAHSFYDSIDKSNIQYDAIISCLSELRVEQEIRDQCVTLIYFFPNYRQIMTTGHYDHYFYWDNTSNPQPLYLQIAVAVRNFRRNYHLKEQLQIHSTSEIF